MVFSNLSSHEKDAFFGLLDEYFQARPEIFAGAGSDGERGISQGAAASAVHRALASNPEATSRLVSAGLTHAGGGAKPNSYMATASNPEVSNSIGRVAAASLAFSANNAKSPPPALPRRDSGNDSSSAEVEHNKLVSARKFGNVDTSSTKNMFGSMIRKSPAPVAAPPIPSAFPARKSGFAPPPVRRGTSDSSETRSQSPAAPPSRYQAPVVQQPQEEEQEEEAQGEWAEALYDYHSEDPADIQIKANQHILVTEKSSEDWWTGTVDGKQGLFPASYVRLL